MNDRELAGRLFARLDSIGRTSPTSGVNRETYGPGENDAHGVVANYAKETLGLHVRTDAVSNLWLTSKPLTGSTIVTGSHLDSVPDGGNFDGAAGVVAGLLVLNRLHRSGSTIPLEVVALRGEESAWWGECYLGSKALLEGLSMETLQRYSKHKRLQVRHGGNLGERIARLRGDHEWWKTTNPIEPLRDPKTISAFLELHIEQGPVLVEANAPIAIVNAIRGNVRYNVTCRGEAGHSGTTPRHMRKDAVIATADLLMRLDEYWASVSDYESEYGDTVPGKVPDLVMTTGVLHTNDSKNAVSVIADETSFSLEWRSIYPGVLENLDTVVKRFAGHVEQARGVWFEFGLPVLTKPAVMTLSEVLRQSVGPVRVMPSGAGHDAAMFAKHGIPSGMIFVRNANGSHNPREAMDMDDFMLGVDALERAVRAL